MRAIVGALVVASVLGTSAVSLGQQRSFEAGTLIVPMDIDTQDAGMLRAFGLVYKLLLNQVPVSWCIRPGKTLYTASAKNPAAPGNAVDFTATAKDVVTGTALGAHDYRGGPFVVDANHKAQALAVIEAWNKGQTIGVAVHEATAAFEATISRTLVNAPNIGINADGNEAIAFGYLNAAGIPDSAGGAWSTKSVDVMTPEQIAGPTTTSHRDGKLWGTNDLPRYCQLMSMHWTVSRDAESNESIAEMREYLLNFPVHLFAECQAVNQLEDAVSGHFVSTDNGTGTPTKSVDCSSNTIPTNGLCAKKPTPTQPLEFLNSDLPFAQMDGPFETVGGSEPSYGLAPGSRYYDEGIVMIREKNVANGASGKSDLWMTGYANFAGGVCQVSEGASPCTSRGKVSYLGGHEYTTKVPISANASTQGTRLFLNSLFEAGCATAEGGATMSLTGFGPTATADPVVTVSLFWSNDGAGVALGAALTDTLPAGATYVSSTPAGVVSAGTVTWTIGDLGPASGGSVMLTFSLPSYGMYENNAAMTYKVGNSARTAAAGAMPIVYAMSVPDAGTMSDAGAGGQCGSGTCSTPLPDGGAKGGAGGGGISGGFAGTTSLPDGSAPDGSADAALPGQRSGGGGGCACSFEGAATGGSWAGFVFAVAALWRGRGSRRRRGRD